MLQLSGISKQYKTGELVQQALDQVSFCLRDNEFVSILGPSGSGKTTLLNIIGGLDRYDDGDLIINGVSTKQYKNKDWDTYRNHTIGFVFQSYNLIPHQSILSNVELALTIGGMTVRDRKRRAKKALEDVGLADQIHKKPNQLSGGQMQRVAIARALVNDPDILLADEPTGALDSETSLQIMELLKKVASNKLVVMVTHNQELAEAYSTRIIKLRDGHIISDSDPVGPQEIQSAAASEPEENMQSAQVPEEERHTGKKKKNASMSFLTSLALSANNLKSKKGRTILISLASSIGIIGIALILSISTGVNDYIYNIQRDTMSSYPITISAQTINLQGLIQEGNSLRDQIMDMVLESSDDDGRVHSDNSTMETSEMFTTSLVENNLTEFKKYLDDPDSEIHHYLGENGIAYTYNVAFDVYTRDPNANLLNTNASVSDISSSSNMFSNMNSGISFMRTNMFAWQNGGISSASNFSELTAGANGDPVSQVVKDNYELVTGKWPEAFNEVVIVLTRSNTLPAETLYQLGIMDGDSYQEILKAIENGEEAPDYSWSYDDILNKSFYLITASDHYVEESDGTFAYLDDSVLNQEQLMENAVELKVSGIIRPDADASSVDITTAVAYTSGLTSYCIDHTQESAVIKAQQADPDTNVLSGMRFVAETEEEKAEDAKASIRAMTGPQKAQLYNLIQYYTENGLVQETADESTETETSGEETAEGETSQEETEGSSSGNSSGNSSGDSLGTMGSMGGSAQGQQEAAEEAPDSEAGGESTADGSEAESESLSEVFGSMEGMDEALQAMGLPDAQTLTQMLRMVGYNNVEDLLGGLNTLFSDENQAATKMDEWLDNDPDPKVLSALYDQYVMGGSYEDNMSAFGMVSYDAPTTIHIYTDTFENKDHVTACINQYNAEADEEHQIVYTDYIALLTTSITQIVNAISYVLIAFVAVSLLVSCIMIGIITHISVLERTKEIGILRALGASKANISQVFNAETVIVGLISGIIGVLIAWLLSLPINLILKILLGSIMVNVHLPFLYALLLILISVVVTVIGGLIPAAKAAKKDPVIALRTE